MLLKIKDIKVSKKRIRQDVGDLTTLKKSLKKHGLLNPISVNPKGDLIAGFRRLQAVKELGWTEIEATVVNPASDIDLLEMEMEENIVRKEFSQTELLEGLKRKKQLVSPNIFIRIWNFIKRIFGIK